jgi:hypothetical protein
MDGWMDRWMYLFICFEILYKQKGLEIGRPSVQAVLQNTKDTQFQNFELEQAKGPSPWKKKKKKKKKKKYYTLYGTIKQPLC